MEQISRIERKAFGWGEKSEEIATAIKLVIKQELQSTDSSFGTISMPTGELRKKTKRNLPNNFRLSALEMINAIRRDKELKKNMGIAPVGETEFITLFSSELSLAIELVQANLSRKNNPATILKLAA